MTHVWLVLSVLPSQHSYITALLFPPPCSLTSRPPEISLLKHHLLSQAPQSLPPSPLLGPKARVGLEGTLLSGLLAAGWGPRTQDVGRLTGPMSGSLCIFPALHPGLPLLFPAQ